MEDKEYKYMVGVRCFTFNQSKYILDALNGFVMQRTNFPYVVMVVDDASTDGEQEVIRKFVDEQFDTKDTSVAYEKETDYAIVTYAQHKVNKNCYFAVLYLKENHYSQRKAKAPYLTEWRDYIKYEALCEGDDYWIHPQKLQMQVDFMEENEEYGLVYGKAKTFCQSKNKFGNIIGSKNYGFEDLLLINKIPTLTTMYRMLARQGYNEFVQNESIKSDWKMGDYPLWLYISMKYKIYFYEDIFGVYRILDNSASHSTSYETQVRFLESAYRVKEFFATKNGKLVLLSDIHEVHMHNMFNLAIVFNNKKDARKFFRKIKNRTIKECIKFIIPTYISNCVTGL